MTRLARIATIGTVCLAGGLLAGCGAGNSTATSKETGSIQGASTNSGTIEIRDAEVVTDGTDAAIEVTLINTGSSTDQLETITTTASDQTRITDVNSNVVEPDLPSNQAVSFGLSGTTIDIGDLTNAPQLGTYVAVTFTFKLAGTTTIQAPVEPLPSASPTS